jgi:hypothetical protein
MRSLIKICDKQINATAMLRSGALPLSLFFCQALLLLTDATTQAASQINGFLEKFTIADPREKSSWFLVTMDRKNNKYRFKRTRAEVCDLIKCPDTAEYFTQEGY